MYSYYKWCTCIKNSVRYMWAFTVLLFCSLLLFSLLYWVTIMCLTLFDSLLCVKYVLSHCYSVTARSNGFNNSKDNNSIGWIGMLASNWIEYQKIMVFTMDVSIGFSGPGVTWRTQNPSQFRQRFEIILNLSF